MDKFPTKKDFWYMLGYFILIDIFLLLNWVTKPSVLGAKLELGSTLISIVLSVIAIIYTLVDSSNNKVTSSKIIESSNTIEKVTNEINNSTDILGEIVQKLANLDISDKLTLFEQSLNNINETTNGICCTMDVLMKNYVTTPNSNQNSNSNLQIKVEELNSSGIYLLNILNENYYHQKEILYIAYKSKDAGTNYINAIDTLLNLDRNFYNSGICHTVSGLLAFLKCYDVEVNSAIIISFNNYFLDIIKSFKINYPDLTYKIDKYFENLV